MKNKLDFENFQTICTCLENRINDFLTVNKKVTIAIDGKCGSGKSTLAQFLSSKFDANVFKIDDYFLQDFQKTEKRLNEVGGFFDYERFYDEIILNLNNQQFYYQKFSCLYKTFEKIFVERKSVNIIEGVYSTSQNFYKNYDIIIYLDIEKSLQLSRIKKRCDAQLAKRYQNEFIPRENLFFMQKKIKEFADFIFLAT